MAQPAPSAPSGPPARTLQGLANIPPPESASEIDYLLASMRSVAETYAMICDNHAIHLRKQLEWIKGGGNMVDRAWARRSARQAVQPIHQGAERARGAAASMRAAWTKICKIYAPLMHPPERNKGIDWQK
jgi:hypothetical protein